MVRRNDLRRMAGYAAVQRLGRNKDGLQEEMQYSRALLDALPPAEYDVQPLYAAAYNGDIAAIRSLAKLKINPNTQHPDSGYTALHAAVFKCKLTAVAALLDCFRGELRLDFQDKKGDTALHVASRMGFVEIAGLICDEPACDPLCAVNNAGQYPIDVVRSHKVFQMIKVCQTRNELQRELQQLRKR
jgi:ankyrin repeat protein